MSTRGLYVGGKSTGNRNLSKSRRTAPVATTQGSAGPVSGERLPVPTLSPKASMQVAALEMQRQQQDQQLKLPEYVAGPKPNNDLQLLAKSLGQFGTQLERTVEAGIKYEGKEQERAQLKAEAIAAQGMAYGPFADYAELTRNLEKASQNAETEMERNRADALLNDLRASSNRVRPYIASQARVQQVKQNAMTLSLAALENPVIGENEDGSELRLHDVDARDPRFLGWQNNHIYGGVTLTPAENKQVSGIVQQATINELSRQQKQKVERDTAALVAHMTGQARALGRTHFTPAPGMAMPTGGMRSELQKLFDDPRMLGVSQEAQTKINNQILGAYQSGAQEGNPNVDLKEVNRVFYSSDDGVENGIMVGPVNQRQKADGSVNTALLWANTQDPDWAIKSENSLEQAQITNRKNEEAQRLTVAKLANEEPLNQALALLDINNPATVDRAEDAIAELNQQIDAREDIDDATKRKLKKFNNDELETAIAGNYSILYERNKEAMSEKIAEMHSGLYTRQEVLEELESKKSVMDHKDWIKLYNLANKEPDPITQTAAAELKTKIDGYKKILRDDTTLSPDQRAARLAGINSMRNQFNNITQEYRSGNLTEDEYNEKVASIKPPAEVELAGAGITTFKQNQQRALLQGFDNEGNYSAQAFNNRLRQMGTKRKDGQLERAYKNGRHILNAEAVLHLYSAYRGGNSSGYVIGNYNYH